MKTFEVFRKHDETGISGTGKVVEGIIFTDGHCVIRWVAMESPCHSDGIFESFGGFLAIHVNSHERNRTTIKFDDGTIYEHTARKRKKHGA